MKKKTVALSLTVIIFFFNTVNLFASFSNPVNSILGDISFISKFGYLPDDRTNENLRIRTHLEYVHEILKSKDITDMKPEVIQKRNIILKLLHEYLSAGIFPRNYEHKEKRVPCFIDKDGRICAVGYLVEKTSGRQAAEQINNEHQYELITEMNDELVNNWIKSSGLTEEECAMIQPTYENYNSISSTDIVISTTLTATNLTFNALNAVSIANGGLKNFVPFLGFITGSAQVLFGVVSLPEKGDYYDGTNKNGLKILSATNIGIGASTIILSVVGLFTDEKKAEKKKTSWNIYSMPAKKEMGVGVTLTHKF